MPTKVNCYDDIEEMPIYNWFKVHSANDYSYLLVKKRKVSDKELPLLQQKWNVLYDQYIDSFGFCESFLTIVEKKCEIALLMIEKAETGNRTLNTFIELEKQKLESLLKNTSGSNFYEIKTYVDKNVGFQMDIRKTSVMEFYTTLNSINKSKKDGSRGSN